MDIKKSALTGRSNGPRSIRTWSRFLFTEDARRILVGVHQVVRDLAGTVLADEHVGHRYTPEHGLLQTMEICLPPASGHGT